MKLYIMRHGHSPSVTEAGVASDAERPLSEQGRQAVRAMAQLLVKSGARPALVLHSPYKRAEQTAREAAEVIKTAGAPRVFKPLENALSAEELARELVGPLAEAREVLAIGHQPQLGDLAAWLSGELFDLRPGGLVALNVSTMAARKAAVLIARNPGDAA